MYPHLYCPDPYYADGIEFEGRGDQCPGLPRAELEIPLRWIMTWLAAATTLALGIGTMLRWMA